MEERLQKVLARAGIASRRKSEEMIEAGRITVNNEIVTQLGTMVDPDQDEIRVDGERIRVEGEPLRYVMLNKPRNVISTTSDELGRSDVLDLIPDAREHRLFPVGRLDAESEGLILLTNDGELANRLTHPRYEHEKEYRVKVFGLVTEEQAERLRAGIYLEEGKTQPAKVRIETASEETTWLRVVLREGKKRQLRRMFEIIGHPVRRLIRVRMGPIELGDLGNGEWRNLAPSEVAALRANERRPKRLERNRTRKPGWALPKSKTGEGRPHGKRRWTPSEAGGAEGEGGEARPRRSLAPTGRGSRRTEGATGERRHTDERPERGERGERDERPRRSEGATSERRYTEERGERGERDERPRRSEGATSERRRSDERPERGERDERPRRSASPFRDRSRPGERPRRSEGGANERRRSDERPERGERDERPRRSEGGASERRRPDERSERRERDERPRRSEGAASERRRPDERSDRGEGRERRGPEDRPRRSEGGSGEGRAPRGAGEARPRQDGDERPRRGTGGARPRRPGGGPGGRGRGPRSRRE